MSRKPLWKQFSISDGYRYNALDSYYQSSQGAWAKYQVIFEGGPNIIETNLPYSELRAWFRFALDEPIPDHVSSVLPSWEIYTGDE